MTTRASRILSSVLVVLTVALTWADPASARPSRHRRRPTGCAGVPACAALSAEAKPAFATLMAAPVFVTESVGLDLPPEVVALRILVLDPNAQGALEHLLLQASPAGKLYAAVGFWRVAPQLFHARREALIHRDGATAVTRQLGQSQHATTIREVLVRHEGAHPFPPGTARLDAFCPGVLRRDDRIFESDYAAGGSSIEMLDGPRTTMAECESWRESQRARSTPAPAAPPAH